MQTAWRGVAAVGENNRDICGNGKAQSESENQSAACRGGYRRRLAINENSWRCERKLIESA